MSGLLELIIWSIYHIIAIFSHAGGYVKGLIILIIISIITLIILLIYFYVIKPKNSSSNQNAESNKLE